jgi:hypothetical protein
LTSCVKDIPGKFDHTTVACKIQKSPRFLEILRVILGKFQKILKHFNTKDFIQICYTKYVTLGKEAKKEAEELNAMALRFVGFALDILSFIPVVDAIAIPLNIGLNVIQAGLCLTHKPPDTTHY